MKCARQGIASRVIFALAGLALLVAGAMLPQVCHSQHAAPDGMMEYGGEIFDEHELMLFLDYYAHFAIAPGSPRDERYGDLRADRPLKVGDLHFLLRLSDFLITREHGWVARKKAAGYLGAYGHRHAIPALLAVSLDEEDHSSVRTSCVYGLSMIQDKRVVDVLIEHGVGSKHAGIAAQAQWELSGLVGTITEGPVDVTSRVVPPYGPEREKLLETWRRWWDERRHKIRDQDLNRTERIYIGG